MPRMSEIPQSVTGLGTMAPLGASSLTFYAVYRCFGSRRAPLARRIVSNPAIESLARRRKVIVLKRIVSAGPRKSSGQMCGNARGRPVFTLLRRARRRFLGNELLLQGANAVSAALSAIILL